MTYRSALLGASFLMIAAPAFAGPTPPSYVPDLVPPNPVAGECYGRVEIPAQYETTTQRVLTRDGHQRLLVQQPQLQAATERVLVKEPSVRYIVQQPTFGTVTERIMTRPGFDKLSVSNPHFQTVTETLQTGQPRLIWKRGNPTKLRAQGYKIHSTANAGVGGRGFHSTTHYGQTGGQACGTVCEIWCLVEEPGESVTVTRQILSQPGQVHRTPVPPQYQSITKQVVTHAGGVTKIPVPGEYRDLHVEKLAHPGGTASINVPAEYGHAQGRKLITPARYEWRRIACKPKAHHPRPTVSSHHSQPATQYHPRVGQHTPLAGHTTTYSHQPVNSGGHNVASNRTYYSSGTTPQSHLTSGTILSQAPLQGTIVHSQPAYSPTYRGHYTGQTTVPSAPVNITVRETAPGYPDRSYSGPAYAATAQTSGR